MPHLPIRWDDLSAANAARSGGPPQRPVAPLVIAHRGARSLAPENTLAAARRAFELGAEMWELDVALTADGELVVIHDGTLERTSDAAQRFPGRAPWSVWAFTLAELQAVDFGTWFGETDPFDQIQAGNVSEEDIASYAGEPIPTLRQALEFTREHNWRVNVELKEQPSEALARTLVHEAVSLIQDLGMAGREQVVVSSFDHDYLRGVRALSPAIPIQALTSTVIEDLAGYLAQLGTDSCNPMVGVWSYQELGELARSGIRLNVWTVNDEATMRELIEAKVHGIFTDFPQRLASIVKRQPG